MDWSAYSRDLNPIKHVWDALGRRIAARLHHPENTQQLKQMLIEDWTLLPQERRNESRERRRKEKTREKGGDRERVDGKREERERSPPCMEKG
ncbi:transposable element Tc1 transposase [Trichonephila clavipes]|nr:transposable element Tc1 transposase [Trichonephila clavipes]